MSIDPQSSLDPEQSPLGEKTEETIPLVTSEGDTPPEETTPEEMDRYECRSCGYTYEPAKGDNRNDVEAGIEFKRLPNSWRCPVCGASKTQFSNVGPAGTASGFKENLSYGLGVNTLTPGQKSVLIFGALGLAVLFFLSLYGLR
ncbi:MAG: rubredoxin [Phormidesmis sp.]